MIDNLTFTLKGFITDLAVELLLRLFRNPFSLYGIILLKFVQLSESLLLGLSSPDLLLFFLYLF